MDDFTNTKNRMSLNQRILRPRYPQGGVPPKGATMHHPTPQQETPTPTPPKKPDHAVTVARYTLPLTPTPCRYTSSKPMNITRRRGAIAFFITLGAILVGLAITQSAWLILNERTVAFAVLGTILFALLVTGVVLNTVFLVREIRRNERQDSFLNAVTHELKTPIASIRLYLETLQRRTMPEEQRQQFYTNMLFRLRPPPRHRRAGP